MASAIHVSGPIAMVIAGLLIGNHGRMFAMSDKTRQHVDDSWHLIDEVLRQRIVAEAAEKIATIIPMAKGAKQA